MSSDEEKKAIKGLFPLAHINTYLDLEKENVVKISRVIIKQWKDETKIVLNLIEKQSKEIEELKNKNKGYDTAYNLGKAYSSKKWKDKIKAKIEDILNSENSEAIEKLIEWQSLLEKEEI